MKFTLSGLLLLIACFASAQKTYKGLPVIKSKSMQADYRINDKWTRGSWGIAPEVSPDKLEIPTFSRTVSFAFKTDSDSIAFPVSSATAKQFYVLTADGKYALTEVRGFDYKPVSFANGTAATYRFWYEPNKDNSFLQTVKAQYPVQDLVKGLTSDSAKALRILKWSHEQWKHNGSNEPSKSDALTILAEAKEGKQFRCVEYGIVGTTALNAIGLPARVVGLKTAHVETTEGGAGHVLLEVYLPDMKKWVLMDGQWDAMPVLNGVPLNAAEFQQAIAGNYDALEIRSFSGTSKDAYTRWIFPYLYYIDVKFDNREGIGLKRETISGKSTLMLVPQGAKEPTVFQKKWPINYALYTHSLADFYAPPQL
jgi:hypothetical protein